MKRKERDSGKPSTAVRFSADEAKHPWLPVLLRMHALVDSGIETAVRAEERRRGVRRACRRGCDVCCRTQSDIPVFQIELAGIAWYSAEKLAGPGRDEVRAALECHVAGASECPFLVEHACAVHPVRPIACRLFTVFGRPCAEGEDPFHGVTDPKDQETWLERGLVDTLAVNLPTRDWRSLARLMNAAP